MTIEELRKRRQLCMENDLCFISLRQFECGEAAVLIMHEELKERVLVQRKYIKELEGKHGSA